MNLAPADHLDHGVAVLAHLDDLAADLQSDFVDDTQDVSLCDRRIRSDDEIRSAQGVEVGGMVGGVERAVKQFAQHLGGARRVNVVDRVRGFGGCHVMRFGAHAADAVGEERHFLHRAADAESFKAAQFGNLEIGIGDIAFVVQENFDLSVTFQTGDGINGHSLCHVCLLMPVLFPRAGVGPQQGIGQVEAIELAGWVRDAIENGFNVFGLIGIHHGCKGCDQARAVVDDAFRRTITTDTLSSYRRAAGIAPAAGGGSVTWDTLFEDAERRVNRSYLLDAFEGSDGLLTLRSRLHSSHTVEFPAPI